MWILFRFYIIIIKSANVDKGGGEKTLIHKMWIKRQVFFKPLPEFKSVIILPKYAGYNALLGLLRKIQVKNKYSMKIWV